jgi:hypothetical protein
MTQTSEEALTAMTISSVAAGGGPQRYIIEWERVTDHLRAVVGAELASLILARCKAVGALGALEDLAICGLCEIADVPTAGADPVTQEGIHPWARVNATRDPSRAGPSIRLQPEACGLGMEMEVSNDALQRLTTDNTAHLLLRASESDHALSFSMMNPGGVGHQSLALDRRRTIAACEDTFRELAAMGVPATGPAPTGYARLSLRAARAIQNRDTPNITLSSEYAALLLLAAARAPGNFDNLSKQEIVDYAYKLLKGIGEMKTHESESHANVIGALQEALGKEAMEALEEHLAGLGLHISMYIGQAELDPSGWYQEARRAVAQACAHRETMCRLCGTHAPVCPIPGKYFTLGGELLDTPHPLTQTQVAASLLLQPSAASPYRYVVENVSESVAYMILEAGEALMDPFDPVTGYLTSEALAELQRAAPRALGACRGSAAELGAPLASRD